MSRRKADDALPLDPLSLPIIATVRAELDRAELEGWRGPKVPIERCPHLRRDEGPIFAIVELRSSQRADANATLWLCPFCAGSIRGALRDIAESP